LDSNLLFLLRQSGSKWRAQLFSDGYAKTLPIAHPISTGPEEAHLHWLILLSHTYIVGNGKALIGQIAMASKLNTESNAFSIKADPDGSSDDLSNVESFGAQIAHESDHAIKYRTCSYPHETARLLFSEYVCLAILSFPWSFSVLGMVPGVILTLVIAGICLYTSLILGRFCIKHPEVRDVCDIGQILFGGSKLAYNITSLFFILNNTFIQALHVLVGAKLLNTLTNSAECTIIFSLVSAVVCFFVSLPRTLDQLSGLGAFSAMTMGTAVILAIVFSGIQDHPFGYIAGQEPLVTAIPVKGTTYVSGMCKFLICNIKY
jgi:hypothetical protein